MAKVTKTITMITTLITMVGCANGIPFMGVKEDGSIMQGKVDPVHYSEQMGSLVNGLETQTVPLLEKKSDEAAQNNSKWEFNTVIVGVGLVMQAGLGPIGGSFEPRFRFILSNLDKPNVP